MKILIAAIHYPVSSAQYIARAFQRLGHDVRTVGTYTGTEIWGMKVSERWVWPPDMLLDQDGGSIGVKENLIDSLDWKAELVITADSMMAIVGETYGPHIVWGVDNHEMDYRFNGVKFDALFLAHSQGFRMGEPNVHWLPCAYDPQAHTDLNTERDYDVGLIGVMYPERVALVDALREAGLRVLAGTGLLWDDYNAAMNRCKLALVQPVANDLPQRFFENMAQGCCVLAPRLHDAEQLGFQSGVDFWPYARAAELVSESRWLIRSGEWQLIAMNGKRKVAPHTWDARATSLLETMGLR